MAKESIKTVKEFNFDPVTDEEKEHLKRIELIRSKIRHGDWVWMAKKMGRDKNTLIKGFYSVYSPLHFMIVEELEYFVDNRMKILAQEYKSNANAV